MKRKICSVDGWEKGLSLKCQGRRRRNLVAHLFKLLQRLCGAIIATVFHPENREEWIYGKTTDWDSHLPSFYFLTGRGSVLTLEHFLYLYVSLLPQL